MVEFNWVVAIVLFIFGGIFDYFFVPTFTGQFHYQIVIIIGGFIPIVLYFLICRMHKITEYAVETKRKMVASYRILSCMRNHCGYKKVILDQVRIREIIPTVTKQDLKTKKDKVQRVKIEYETNHTFIPQGYYAGHFLSEDMMCYVVIKNYVFFDIIPKYEIIIIPEKDYITFDPSTQHVIIEGTGFYVTEDGTFLVHPKVPTMNSVERESWNINELTRLEAYNKMMDKAGGIIRKAVTLNWDQSYTKSIKERPPK